MTADLTRDEEFLKLEKEYKFLSRARQSIAPETMGLGMLAYTIVDIETTGLEPTIHEITEIGAIKVLASRGIEKFEQLIKPARPISDEITRLTGITNEMVADKPSLETVLPKFLAFIDDSVLVAHNTEFDLAFLKHHAYKALNREIKNPSVCTVLVSRVLLPHLENHKLHTVAAYFDIQIENRHRAMGDAELTLQTWLKMMELLKEKNVNTLTDLNKYTESMVPF